MRFQLVATLCAIFLTTGCAEKARLSVEQGTGAAPQIPEPVKTLLPTMNIAKATAWADGETPVPAQGLKVTAFAKGLDHPRWIYVLPNGDVLVAETNAPQGREGSKGVRGWFEKQLMGKAGAVTKSANRITLLRDVNGDGVADERSVFLQNLNSPFGMALVGEDFYVANTDAIVRFPYKTGETSISAAGEKLTDLPAGLINHHWTKNIIASPDGATLYATSGSNSNVGENGLDEERERAAILQVDRASGQKRLFASGLRNPNGLAWEPQTGALWTTVNERDEIGSDLVPDYMTSVRRSGFYGWPYSYYGQHVDDRVKPQRPDLVASAISPDYALGPHTASLGLAFYQGTALGPNFTYGAIIGQHGSWNRDPLSGYKVIFVPFQNGKPSGPPVDLLTGFLDTKNNAKGRPVGVALDKRGGVLVADDVGDVIWRVSQ